MSYLKLNNVIWQFYLNFFKKRWLLYSPNILLLWKKFIFLFVEIRKDRRDKDRQQIEWEKRELRWLGDWIMYNVIPSITTKYHFC